MAFTHSPRDMSHARERKPPAVDRPVNSPMSVSAYGTTSARSSRIRARSTVGVGGPLPPTRRPVWVAVPQSTSAAAREPMDQSMVASMAGEGLALGLLTGCDHGRAPSLALGDATVRTFLEQFGEDPVERLLVEAHLRMLDRRRGRGCRGAAGEPPPDRLRRELQRPERRAQPEPPERRGRRPAAAGAAAGAGVATATGAGAAAAACATTGGCTTTGVPITLTGRRTSCPGCLRGTRTDRRVCSSVWKRGEPHVAEHDRQRQQDGEQGEQLRGVEHPAAVVENRGDVGIDADLAQHGGDSSNPDPSSRRRVEPERGFEPLTYHLRGGCSA